jgi:site-specific DNA-methyltransferase (adenine-specific)
MREIPDQSVDLVLCDLPYGTTQNKWDAIIPFDALWKQYRRVSKLETAIILTASQPFTSALVMSNPKMFKYVWVWKKTAKTGFLNAKRQPLRQHEDIVVFCEGQTTYNPQGTRPCVKINKRGGTGGNYGTAVNEYPQTTENYPTTILEFNSQGGTVHPTQKPVPLFDYLIRTYTEPGALVLDNCMGSGTTGVACAQSGRKFIGIEKDEAYFQTCVERVSAAQMSAPKPVEVAI